MEKGSDAIVGTPDFIGVPGRNRTYDQRIRSPLLYPLSYWDTGTALHRKNMERVKGIEPS